MRLLRLKIESSNERQFETNQKSDTNEQLSATNARNCKLLRLWKAFSWQNTVLREPNEQQALIEFAWQFTGETQPRPQLKCRATVKSGWKTTRVWVLQFAFSARFVGTVCGVKPVAVALEKSSHFERRKIIAFWFALEMSFFYTRRAHSAPKLKNWFAIEIKFEIKQNKNKKRPKKANSGSVSFALLICLLNFFFSPIYCRKSEASFIYKLAFHIELLWVLRNFHAQLVACLLRLAARTELEFRLQIKLKATNKQTNSTKSKARKRTAEKRSFKSWLFAPNLLRLFRLSFVCRVLLSSLGLVFIVFGFTLR